MNIFCWKTTKSTLSNIANFGLFATYLGEEPPLPFVIYPHDPGTATDAEVCTGVSDSNLWFPPIFFSSSSIGIEIEHDLRDGWWCTELCVHPGEQNITMIPTHGHRLTQGSLATPIVTEWGCSSPRLTHWWVMFRLLLWVSSHVCSSNQTSHYVCASPHHIWYLAYTVYDTQCAHHSCLSSLKCLHTMQIESRVSQDLLGDTMLTLLNGK